MKSREYDASGRQRQNAIDRITARYVAEAEAGRHPDPKDYLARYPEYAAEIADFIVTYHLSLVDWPEPEETAYTPLPSEWAQALEQATKIVPAPAVQASPTFASLADRAFDVGLDPDQLAARVHLSPSFIDRLDTHSVTDIPRELFRRLAEALDVTSEAIMSFLSASAQTGGAFYHASEAPSTAQDDFLAAIEASDDLDPAFKAEWRAIRAGEQNG